MRSASLTALVALAALFALAGGAAGSRGEHARASASDALAPSLFGINTQTYDDNYHRFLRDMPTAKAMGARWIHLTGGNIKYTARGRLTFAQMDSQVNRARRLGLGVLMSLGGIRAACSIHSASPATCPPTTSHDRHVYFRYVKRLLRHFRGRVTYFESWVEPNHRSYWPSGPDPAQYAALLRTEHRAFVAADPSAKLLFAGVADFGIESDDAVLPYTQRVLDDLHGAKVFDAVALHGYRYPPTLSPNDQGWSHYPSSPHWRRETWRALLGAYEQEFTDHGYGQPPLWLTEFGWPGNRSAGSGRPADYFPGVDTQASDIAEAYETLRTIPFVQAAFWFNLRDYQPGVPNPDPSFFAHYGLLYPNFAPKPAAAVFERLAGAG